ncbi:MAG: hypothetical protein FWF51_01525 [Chitinivibrionia bacterium]|nr:hypothetical protein [Chitinivibrionia bacterium]
MTEFNSQDFFTHIKKLADKYYELIKNNSETNFVEYDSKKIDAIKKIYPVRLDSVKKEIYGERDIETGNKIDRHKIVSLYMQLFLENPVFKLVSVPTKKYPSPKMIFINESFCFDIMTVILQVWTGKKFNLEKFDDYKTHFFKLLSYYKEHSEFYKRNAFFTHTLAHIIYFIELNFMK